MQKRISNLQKFSKEAKRNKIVKPGPETITGPEVVYQNNFKVKFNGKAQGSSVKRQKFMKSNNF